jgi:hypothetical protein
MSEASPIPPEFRQAFAWLSQSPAKVVATADEAGHIFPAAGCLSLDPCSRRDLAQSPSSRPVPFLERPGLSLVRAGAGDENGRGIADPAHGWMAAREFLFIDASAAVHSAAITTQRGNEPCGNTSSSLHLRPRPLRAACRPRPSVVLPVLSPVRPSRMQRMRTWLLAQQSAVCWALHPAACRGCRPANATDLIAAACGRSGAQTGRPSGHIAPVAFVISAPRPGRGGRGERCSRRS